MSLDYRGDLFTGTIERSPELRVFLADDEVAVDGFAGGGGVSTGIEWAIGRSPDIAINHNEEALAMHRVNHPETHHEHDDIREVRPSDALRGRRCGFLWLSPDCTYFSKATGGAPFRDRNHARKIRGLINVALLWADLPAWQRPRVIFIENVEEIVDWCPIGEDGRPDFSRRGSSFRRFIAALRNKGYRKIEWRRLRGRDYGAPTVRQRLYIIARCDDQPIVWPEPTHGPGLEPYRAVAECIDFDLPIPSIFLTRAKAKAWGKTHGLPSPKRPLARATLQRLARGVLRYVVEDPDPFIVPGEQSPAPFIGKPRHALVAAFLAKHNGGNEATGQRLVAPADTITTRDQKALVTSHLLKLRGGFADHVVTSQDVRLPAPTLTAGGTHLAEVRAFLLKYYGSKKDGIPVGRPIDTIPTKDRFALVTVSIAGEDYILADIGMRMLTPRELFRAQGFPDTYRIDVGLDAFGQPVKLTKKAQTRLVGNSVVPHVAAAIVSANMREQPWRFERAA